MENYPKDATDYDDKVNSYFKTKEDKLSALKDEYIIAVDKCSQGVQYLGIQSQMQFMNLEEITDSDEDVELPDGEDELYA